MTLEHDAGRKRHPARFRLPAVALLMLAALGARPALAVDLSECFKMSAEQKAYLNDLEFDCLARNVYCEVVLMTIPEVDAKVAEIAAWNEAYGPERERKLRSGLGACDQYQQAYLVEEIVHLANPGPSQAAAQRGWQGGTGQPVYVDPKGQRWRFEPELRTGGRTYILDRSRQPRREAQGVLVQMMGYYTAPGAPDVVYAGTMDAAPAPEPAPAPDPPIQSRNPRPSRDVLCQRNPQLYSCLGG